MMNDLEPYWGSGEYLHPANGCKHDRETIKNRNNKQIERLTSPFKRKRDRRAMTRAVKAIRKLRRS